MPDFDFFKNILECLTYIAIIVSNVLVIFRQQK